MYSKEEVVCNPRHQREMLLYIIIVYYISNDERSICDQYEDC